MSTPTQNMTSKNTPAFSDPANTWNQRFAAPGFLFGAERGAGVSVAALTRPPLPRR